MSEVVWESLYQRAIEHLTLTDSGGRIRAESVIGAEQFGLRYSIDCDARWNFERAEIVCGQRRLEIRRSGPEWRVNRDERHDLRECTEIDIAATPFTNTLPIRRLQIPIGEERVIAVVYIKPPELEVSRMQQRYRRIDALRYAYSGGGDYTITVDADGLVTDYPPWFRRIPSTS
ncbi:MAG: putative glycolipid-binding domain-containing protein [Acidobacteriota bacterium]|nr:putative glycolipid-binding domain-containing protein [Acidobacteriota bacterium]